jgi:hypothetical protein
MNGKSGQAGYPDVVFLRYEPAKTVDARPGVKVKAQWCDVVAYACLADAQAGYPIMARWAWWTKAKPNASHTSVRIGDYRYPAQWLDHRCHPFKEAGR